MVCMYEAKERKEDIEEKKERRRKKILPSEKAKKKNLYACVEKKICTTV